MSEYTTEIITGIITLALAIVGGSMISIRRSKKRSQKVNQSNISIEGDNNKIVGGDDKSSHSTKK